MLQTPNRQEVESRKSRIRLPKLRILVLLLFLGFCAISVISNQLKSTLPTRAEMANMKCADMLKTPYVRWSSDGTYFLIDDIQWLRDLFNLKCRTLYENGIAYNGDKLVYFKRDISIDQLWKLVKEFGENQSDGSVILKYVLNGTYDDWNNIMRYHLQSAVISIGSYDNSKIK